MATFYFVNFLYFIYKNCVHNKSFLYSSYFKRRSNNYDNLEQPRNEHSNNSSNQIIIHPTIVVPVNSNNILNANLSGSFKNEDDDDDDDELLGDSSTVEQYRQQRKNHSTPNLPTRSKYYDTAATASSAASSSSNNLVDVEVGPSTSRPSVIAALPNVNFNPLHKSNTRHFP